MSFICKDTYLEETTSFMTHSLSTLYRFYFSLGVVCLLRVYGYPGGKIGSSAKASNNAAVARYVSGHRSVLHSNLRRNHSTLYNLFLYLPPRRDRLGLVLSRSVYTKWSGAATPSMHQIKCMPSSLTSMPSAIQLVITPSLIAAATL